MPDQPPRYRKLIRRAVIAVLFACPLVMLWNLVAEQTAPERTLRAMQLIGVTNPPPRLVWSLRSFADGTLQAAVARAVAEAAPLRPLMIRINNEIRYSLFGYISVPEIIEGDQGQLVERSYLSEYCSRGPDSATLKARELIPKLRDIQAYFRARNRLFLYVITPSKVAHLPEHFVHRFPCANSEQNRAAKLPTLVNLLRKAGINVLDTASIVHHLKGRERVDLFPRGGVHWNSLAVAHAANAIVAELDRLAARPIIPQFTWSYEVNSNPRSFDRDLADLMNLLFPRTRYETPELTFRPSAPCAGQSSSKLDVALVGSSFTDGLAQVMVRAACLPRLYVYRYLTRLRHGGVPETWKADLDDHDIAAIRDADVLIVEENESFAPESNYIAKLRALISGSLGR